MSRRYGHRGRRRPTGPRTSSVVQLGLLVLGLVILLSFRSDIADGAAGCFDSMASVDEADATASPADAGPTAPIEAVAPEEQPSAGTPVSVNIVHTGPEGDATGSEDAEGADVPAPEQGDVGAAAPPEQGDVGAAAAPEQGDVGEAATSGALDAGPVTGAESEVEAASPDAE